jgi:hypothetical protein
MNPQTLQLAQRIVSLALTTPRSVADVFVTISPHVSQISIDLYAGGWRADAGPTWTAIGYYAGWRAAEKPIDALRDHLVQVLTALQNETEDVACST